MDEWMNFSSRYFLLVKTGIKPVYLVINGLLDKTEKNGGQWWYSWVTLTSNLLIYTNKEKNPGL